MPGKMGVAICPDRKFLNHFEAILVDAKFFDFAPEGRAADTQLFSCPAFMITAMFKRFQDDGTLAVKGVMFHAAFEGFR